MEIFFPAWDDVVGDPELRAAVRELKAQLPDWHWHLLDSGVEFAAWGRPSRLDSNGAAWAHWFIEGVRSSSQPTPSAAIRELLQRISYSKKRFEEFDQAFARIVAASPRRRKPDTL